MKPITVTNVNRHGKVSSKWNVKVGKKWRAFTQEEWERDGLAYINAQLKEA